MSNYLIYDSLASPLTFRVYLDIYGNSDCSKKIFFSFPIVQILLCSLRSKSGIKNSMTFPNLSQIKKLFFFVDEVAVFFLVKSPGRYSFIVFNARIFLSYVRFLKFNNSMFTKTALYYRPSAIVQFTTRNLGLVLNINRLLYNGKKLESYTFF